MADGNQRDVANLTSGGDTGSDMSSLSFLCFCSIRSGNTLPLLSNGRSSSIVLISHANSSAEQSVGTDPFFRHKLIVANEHLRTLGNTE